MECVRLRVKDIDFAYHQVIVRDGKGAQDRVTILPQSLEEALHRQLAKTKLVHEEDLAAGYGEVYLPYPFARKIHTWNVAGVAVCFPSLQTLSRFTLIRERRHQHPGESTPKGGETGDTPGGAQ